MQQFRSQALMATPPLIWGTDLVSLDTEMTSIYKLPIGIAFPPHTLLTFSPPIYYSLAHYFM
jgi:hypothetical protein